MINFDFEISGVDCICVLLDFDMSVQVCHNLKIDRLYIYCDLTKLILLEKSLPVSTK